MLTEQSVGGNSSDNKRDLIGVDRQTLFTITTSVRPCQTDCFVREDLSPSSPQSSCKLDKLDQFSFVLVIFPSASCCHPLKNVTQATGNFVLSSMPSQSIIDWF